MDLPAHYQAFLRNHRRQDPSGRARRLVERLFRTRHQVTEHGSAGENARASRAFVLRQHEETRNALTRYLGTLGMDATDAQRLCQEALDERMERYAEKRLLSKIGRMEHCDPAPDAR